MNDLSRLASLIKQRNVVGEQITAIVGQPALIGHVGEYIASCIFGIEMEHSAVAKGIDPDFPVTSGFQERESVQWWLRRRF